MQLRHLYRRLQANSAVDCGYTISGVSNSICFEGRISTLKACRGPHENVKVKTMKIDIAILLTYVNNKTTKVKNKINPFKQNLIY